jgi:hypothetical protein
MAGANGVRYEIMRDTILKALYNDITLRRGNRIEPGSTHSFFPSPVIRSSSLTLWHHAYSLWNSSSRRVLLKKKQRKRVEMDDRHRNHIISMVGLGVNTPCLGCVTYD